RRDDAAAELGGLLGVPQGARTRKFEQGWVFRDEVSRSCTRFTNGVFCMAYVENEGVVSAPQVGFEPRLVKKFMRHGCNTSTIRLGPPDSVLGFWAYARQLFPTGTGGLYLFLGGSSPRENDR